MRALNKELGKPGVAPFLERTAANISERTFFIRTHPVAHLEDTGWGEIVMHEAMHMKSGAMDQRLKRRLTEEYFSACPIKVKPRCLYHLLDEPLAVAWGKIVYKRFGKKQDIEPGEINYFDPLPDLLGRLLWPHVEQIYGEGDTIEDGMIDQAGKYCAQVLSITEVIDHERTE